MNYMLTFDHKGGQYEQWTGPVPRVGEYVELPTLKHKKRVAGVTYRYGERGLEDVLVRVVNHRKGKK